MRKIAPLILAASAALAGCVTVEAPDGASGAGMCSAQRALSLIGQKASSETGTRVLSLSGARSLRWGPPSAMWTMDFREDRVNVRYDAAMTITEITCG